MNVREWWATSLIAALWLAVLWLFCLCVAMLLTGCIPPPPTVDELNTREQERLAKEAAAATTP